MNNYALINYWPINNNMDDYVGKAHMNFLTNNEFCADRLNNPYSALNFMNGYNEIPPGVYINGDFTFTAWINYSEFFRWIIIMQLTNEQLKNTINIYAQSHHLRCPGASFSGEQTNTELICTENLSTDHWYHIAITLCGRIGRIYVDGILKNESKNTARPENVVRYNNFIGRDNLIQGWNERHLNGKLDEIRIYNRCLSQNEIMNLMQFVDKSPIV